MLQGYEPKIKTTNKEIQRIYNNIIYIENMQISNSHFINNHRYYNAGIYGHNWSGIELNSDTLIIHEYSRNLPKNATPISFEDLKKNYKEYLY